MPDVELFDLRYDGDQSKVADSQSVSRVYGELELRSKLRSLAQRGDWCGIFRLVCELARVELDRFCADFLRHPNCFLVRADEEAGAYSSAAQRRNRALDSWRVSHDVEAPFRGDLLAPLGDERHLIGLDGDRGRDHLVGAGDLEVEIGPDGGPQNSHIGVLDVPPVLAKVRRNAVGANFLANEGRLDGVGLVAAPRLPERRDVVDVYIKTLVACSHIRPEYNFLTMKKLMLAFVVAGAAACSAAPPSTSVVDNSPGAKTSIGAVDRFFAAVHAQDLQAMSLVWGTSNGSARDNMPRAEMEKREVILQCYFNSDTFRVLGESPISETRRMVRVELQREREVRTPVIYTVLGPNNRWYVENLDIAAVKDFCAMAPANPGD
jgi:hypothetical protein